MAAVGTREPHAEQPPRARRRWPWVVAWILLLILVAALLRVGVRSFVEQSLVTRLQEFGFTKASLRVDSVSLGVARLSGVELEAGRLASRIEVRYSPSGLRRSELEQLTIERAEFLIGVSERGMDLGSISAQKTGETEPASTIPFEQLVIRDSAVTLAWGAIQVRLPIELSLTRLSAARVGVEVDATIQLPFGPIRMKGEAERSGNGWSLSLASDPFHAAIDNTALAFDRLTLHRTPRGGWTLACEGLGVRHSRGFLGDIAASITWGVSPPQGRFRVGRVIVADRSLPAIEGDMVWIDGGLKTDARWPLLPEVIARISASMNPTHGFEMKGNVESVDLAGLGKNGWLPLDPGVTAAGRANAGIRLAMVDGRWSNAATLDLVDAEFGDPRRGLEVRGLSASMTCQPLDAIETLRVEDLRAAAVSVPGWFAERVRLSHAELRGQKLRVVGLRVGDAFESGEVTCDLKRGDNGWSAETVQVNDAVLTAKIEGGNIRLPGVRPEAREPAPPVGGANVLPARSFSLRRSAVMLDWGGPAIRIPLAAEVTQAGSGVAIEADLLLMDSSVRLHGKVIPQNPGGHQITVSADPARWNLRGASASWESLRLNGLLTSAGWSTLQLGVSGAQFAGDQWAFRDASIDVPLAGATDKRGAFRVGAIDLMGKARASMTGEVTRENGRLVASAEWPLIAASPVRLKGWVDSNLNAEAQVLVEPFDYAKASELAEWVRLPESVTIGGRVGLDAGIGLTRGVGSATATVTIRDGHISDSDSKIEVDGINGAVTFDRLNPLGTKGSQQFKIASVKIGDTKLVDGEVVLSFDRPDSVLIEKTGWNWPTGGSLRAFSTRIEPGRPVAAEVYFEDTPITPWVAWLSFDAVRGEGRVYGRVPLQWDASDRGRPLRIGRGFLYANPEPGWFKISDRDLVRSLLNRAGIEAVSVEVRDRLEEGLTNFEFTQLKLDFFPDPQGGRCVIFTKGQSRNLERPVNYQGFTVNLENFEKTVNDLLVETSMIQALWKRKNRRPAAPIGEKP